MSVLVVGMDMPTTCTLCDLAHAMKKSDGTAKLACGVTGKWQDDYVRRPRWCPLQEVTEDEIVNVTFADWKMQEAGELSIGDRLAIRLAKIGMSQRELAKRLNVTEVSVSRYVNNQRVPKASVLARIADILSCTTDELLGRA